MQKVRKLPISVIMVVNNEAHNIRRSLGSVYGWVEEIVVVVNDCTDGTDRIARETFNARIYEHPWHGFRDQKRIAFDYAQQKWVLGLDADEEVSIQLKASIFNFFNSQNCEQYQGAYFARKTWFLGRWIKHGDWYPDHQLRLAQKDVSHYGGTLAHDKIIIKGKSQKISGDLYHYSFQSLQIQLGKIGYFGQLSLKEQLKKKKKFFLPSIVFRCLWRFFRCYVIRLGFLDGFPGFYIACSTMFSILFARSLVYEHSHPSTPPVNSEAIDKK